MIILYILGALVGAFLLYLVFLAISCLVVSTKKEYNRNSPFYRYLMDSITVAVLKLSRVRVHATGVEKVPKGAKLLFMSNHRSKFDPIVTWYIFKDWKLAYVSKPENFKIPFFNRIIRRCCFMPIDRENPRKAILTINRAATLLKNQEVSIGVYPEGTRSKTCELLPFHNGVFKIAQKADAPIVVMSVTGTEKIAKLSPFHHTDVYLDVLEVFTNVKETKTELIGTAARRLIESNIEKRENLWQKDM